MTKMRPSQIYWIRYEAGMVDSMFVKYFFQWYRNPELQVVVSVNRFYKSTDTPVNSPMLSHPILVALCPSVARQEFESIAAKYYDKKLVDRGAENACKLMFESEKMVCVFRDDLSFSLVGIESASLEMWDGSDVLRIKAEDIKVLRDTIDLDQESYWSPSTVRHQSWNKLECGAFS